MNLHKLYLTENACYKANRKHTVKGIMVHSTGANNPWLKRYVGPDDGLLGKNEYNNHWNTYHPGGREVCVHGFIGKLADGSIATYQTLPWDICGWHSGSGSKGNANFLGYIGFEICEDGLTDKTYFNKVYTEAVELCVYLCKQYNLTEKNIICHSEGYAQGIASNHGDVMHWFPKFGKSMDTFRAEVKAGLGTAETKTTATTEVKTATSATATTIETKTTATETKTTTATTANSTTTIKAGDIVKITGTKYYGGQTIPTWVKNQNWYVHSVSGDRAVINKNEKGDNAIMSPVKTSDLKVVKTASTAATNTTTAKTNTTTTTSTTYKTYTVVKGDSLWSIAAKQLGNGSRYTEIKKLNNLTSDIIHSGQVLKLPNK